ncbi:MAG: 3-dehydroquinate dehydratase [Bacteroidetes bacterium]|nr:3-dehydroquinate dehydratase [Bacteroidota bacterium]
MNICIINGPNLNLVGRRQPEIYGEIYFEEYLEKLIQKYPEVNFTYYQSNVEGDLINQLQETGFLSDGIILNAGGYTHTSVAIADCVASIATPVIEVHISNILNREEFRHSSLIAKACKGSIIGLGLDGYELGLKYFIELQ